jgi:dTDP-4-dehydrorhamnose 3,5-epimerase
LQVKKTDLTGVLVIKRSIFQDHRGSFVETYNEEEYNDLGIPFVRDALSTSCKNVLRGLHYDDKTWKLIQCMAGEIFFVVVDMRKDSGQYLKWQSFVLTEQNRHQVLVPPMFANGHLVLSERCIFHYKMSEYYDPENERTLKWDDPKANINWPIKNPILSEKDAKAEFLA